MIQRKKLKSLLAAWGACLIAAHVAADPPKLFDQWTYQPTQQTAIQSGGHYGFFVPVGYAESPEYFRASLAGNAKQGLFKAVQTRCWKLSRVEQAFEWAEKNNLGMDYVFADAECDGMQGDIDLMQSYIDRVRASPDARLKRAKIGNWSWFDGMFTDTWWFYQPWPVWPEHARAEEFVRTKLQVSQPSLYPYSFNIKHVTAGDSLNGAFYKYVGGSSPNERSAQFWAPLEILSSAKRRLPQGQELIPYVSDYLHVKGFDPKPDQMLTDADYAASIFHYRLRGADGLYAWSEKNDARYLQYRTLVAVTWRSLDDFFGRPGSLELLNAADNFGTHKSEGVEWSAALKGNRVIGIVSNLSNAPKSLDWTRTEPPTGMPSRRASILALPPRSPTLAPGSHATLQYRTPYHFYETFETVSIGQTLDKIDNRSRWQGPNANAGRWIVAAPLGSGNRSDRVVAPIAGAKGENNAVWFKTSRAPGFSADDRVSYSAMFYFDRIALRASPINSSGVGEADFPDESRCGPEFAVASIDGDWNFTFKKVAGRGDEFTATNRRPVASHWYEFRVDVDPREGSGMARVWIRDVTLSERDFSALIWRESSAKRSVDVPLSLSASRNPTNFDAWQVSADGGAQFDNFNAGYFVPSMDENFSGYDPTHSLATQGWTGASAAQWEIAASFARPVHGARDVTAWRRTSSPEFDAGDVVVYSATLTGGAGFSPIAIAEDGSAVSGPIFSIGVGEAGFFLRPSSNAAENFKAMTAPVAGHQYEVQIVIDPVRATGVAKVYVRDLTADGRFVQLAFSSESQSGRRLLELPLALSANDTTTKWDGWRIYGANGEAQIGNLKALLYPFKEFAVGGAIEATMSGPNP